MRFGTRNIWKIGISQNPKQRRDSLNFSVPVEELKEQWELEFTHKWQSGALAYQMEQAILQTLANSRTSCERVRCDRNAIERAWNEYIAAAKL
jgi:hypothetical protein